MAYIAVAKVKSKRDETISFEEILTMTSRDVDPEAMVLKRPKIGSHAINANMQQVIQRAKSR